MVILPPSTSDNPSSSWWDIEAKRKVVVVVVLLLLLWCSPPCCQPDHKKKEVLFCFLRNSSFTLRSRYQVYFHFLHHHQPLNHLRMEVNEFSNLSLFTLNVNSTMLRWRKPREWKKQPCTSRRLWQSTSLLSRFSRYLRSWNPYFLQCNSFGVIVSVPVFQRNPKNLFLLVSYNIKSSGTGTRGVKAWGWPWWGRQGRAKAGKATGKE